MNLGFAEILAMLGTASLVALKIALVVALIIWIVRAVSTVSYTHLTLPTILRV